MGAPALRRRFNEQLFDGPRAARTIEEFARSLPREASIKGYTIEYNNGVIHNGAILEEALSNLRKYDTQQTRVMCKWTTGEQEVASLEFDWIACAVSSWAFSDNPQSASAAVQSLQSVPLPVYMDLSDLRAQFAREIVAAQQQNSLAKAETDAALFSIRTQLQEASLRKYAEIFRDESHAHGELARSGLLRLGQVHFAPSPIRFGPLSGHLWTC